MAGDRSEVDLDKAMLDPESVFATPDGRVCGNDAIEQPNWKQT